MKRMKFNLAVLMAFVFFFSGLAVVFAESWDFSISNATCDRNGTKYSPIVKISNNSTKREYKSGSNYVGTCVVNISITAPGGDEVYRNSKTVEIPNNYNKTINFSWFRTDVEYTKLYYKVTVTAPDGTRYDKDESSWQW